MERGRGGGTTLLKLTGFCWSARKHATDAADKSVATQAFTPNDDGQPWVGDAVRSSCVGIALRPELLPTCVRKAVR
jgi:hypothetical protein